MEPLSVAASIVGVVVPALHAARLLLDDLQEIRDASKTMESLKKDLHSVERSLESLQGVDGAAWTPLGETMANEFKVAIDNCKKACDTLRDDLKRWTRHSKEGKLSWQDQATVGFFKQRRIKSTSEQLQNCKLTINSVVSIATLYVPLLSSNASDEVSNYHLKGTPLFAIPIPLTKLKKQSQQSKRR